MGNAVDKCVHCGLCLATCPTYILLGEEMDSPRGRIFLMKEALEGSLTTEEVMPYIDRCLGCMACTTACPSGVEYGDLLAPFRAKAERYRRRPVMRHRSRGDSSARRCPIQIASARPSAPANWPDLPEGLLPPPSRP